MRNKKTIFGLGLLAAILMLGIGYAAVSDIDLNIENVQVKEEIVVSNPREKEICEMIDAIDVNKMTPLDAMMFLCELKRK